MQQGAYISGILHGGLILWVLFAGVFVSRGDSLPIETMDVSVLSVEEFAELTAPEQAELEQPDVAQEPAPQIEPEAIVDTSPQVPLVEPEVETPEPDAPLTPSQPVLEAAPDAPQSPEPPKPAEAERVAPEIAQAPPETAEIAPEVVPEIAPDETAETPTEEAPATAPEEAATEIVTEAEEPSSAAPVTSFRPTARPASITAQPEPVEEPQTEDALANALAEATAETQRPVPSGPPLSIGEKDALRVSVQKCWNVGSLSTEALQTTVTVYVAMQQDGKPEVGSIKMIEFEGGSEAAAKKAYEAARRAIIRCGASGFDLPREKYSHWQEIEMIFNPNNMRVK